MSKMHLKVKNKVFKLRQMKKTIRVSLSDEAGRLTESLEAYFSYDLALFWGF